MHAQCAGEAFSQLMSTPTERHDCCQCHRNWGAVSGKLFSFSLVRLARLGEHNRRQPCSAEQLAEIAASDHSWLWIPRSDVRVHIGVLGKYKYQDTGSMFDGWKEALDSIFGCCSCPHIAEDALEGVQGDREDLV